MRPKYKHCDICNDMGVQLTGCSYCGRRQAYFPATAGYEERFWGRVQKTPGCWIWLGGVSSHGYGQFRYNGENWRAHKLSWFLTHGIVPKGLSDMKVVLMHSCDVKRCVNPAHLSVATQKENIQDMIRKGRKVCWNKGMRKATS